MAFHAELKEAIKEGIVCCLQLLQAGLKDAAQGNLSGENKELVFVNGVFFFFSYQLEEEDNHADGNICFLDLWECVEYSFIACVCDLFTHVSQLHIHRPDTPHLLPHGSFKIKLDQKCVTEKSEKKQLLLEQRSTLKN